MFKAAIVCIFVFLGLNLSGFAQQKKFIFIILDGIPASELERVDTPNLDQIAVIGGYVRAYTGGEKGGNSETPTISAVGYNSLLTGTWANKHNVWDNDIKAPNYSYWSIFRLMREARPASKLAIFSTWEDNRTKLLGEGMRETGNLKLDIVFDGFEKDTLRFPHDSEKEYLNKIDNLVSFEAAHVLKTQSPDLSWVYLEYTDAIGHRYGKSQQFSEAIEIADQQVGKIWEAIQYREKSFGEEWLIWITTDHGRKTPDLKDHGGQSDSEREIWMLTNAKNLNSHFFSGNASMVDILPTIVHFLEINTPEEQMKNWDGRTLLKKK
ncbi:Type I phosphodiesterase / nucleotide pyrophosphatase [Algoriphagus faecimaris]|uniref:Type I phosphodiesterase / nucleotide pyrophosphatase n=1 Tax=Algoriphagus faecimaris TaxID=686796 RepID=A0A1G6XB90_9BACT|nr:alkaline phosphatase family protein [Algoriphagus faecimaris]SDD75351.1 Type I phosphodiesterase / nucleotide pyrophosphatase [Algoriphagus faecimaris]